MHETMRDLLTSETKTRSTGNASPCRGEGRPGGLTPFPDGDGSPAEAGTRRSWFISREPGGKGT